MRRSTLSLLAVAFTLALTLSHAQAAGGVEDAKVGIAQSNAKWEAAAKAGDSAAIAALYTSDALSSLPIKRWQRAGQAQRRSSAGC
jgi:hypothetical protein